MANPYAELFQAPGSRAFVSAGMLARMPISMTGIGLITMLSQLRGGYGLAGAVAATFALATAFCAPQVSRLVDRYGQGRVLPVAAMIGGGALLLLLLYRSLLGGDIGLNGFELVAVIRLSGCGAQQYASAECAGVKDGSNSRCDPCI